jgi:hypothetical protein
MLRPHNFPLECVEVAFEGAASIQHFTVERPKSALQLGYSTVSILYSAKKEEARSADRAGTHCAPQSKLPSDQWAASWNSAA